jgi:DNA segregation ATPase FtsK/SpoIIIE, S-DNA-T family
VAMSSAERSYHGPFTVDDFRAIVHRRLREVAGLGLIAVSCGAAAALATWSVKDPSFSHATSAPVRNLLGAPGAIAADLATQLFGLATIAIILPIAAWGWRLLTHRPLDRMRWRVPAWLVGLVAAAAFASCLTRTPQWPLPTGIGGVIGDAVIRAIASIVGGPLFGTGRTVAAVSFGIISLAMLVIACGFGFQRSGEERDVEEAADEDDEGGSVSIGWVVHYFLSLKARFFRPIAAVFAHAFRSLLARPSAAPSTRAEPRFAAGAGPSAQVPDDEPEPEEDSDEPGPKVVRGTRKPPRPAPKAARKSPDGYEMPPLNLLAAPSPRTASRRAPRRSSRPRSRSSMCWATSACAAKSSMRGRARW